MRFLNGYMIGGVLFAIVGAAALTVNTLIIIQSGDMQAATAEGKWLLSWAGLVVHIGGVVVFGMMAGYHAAEGNKGTARAYMAMLLGAALYSGWQVASFASAELASQTREREIAEQRADHQFKAGLDLDAKRLEIQGKLAADQLKANQTAARDGGRREKRDALEESRKLIAEVGKIEVRAVPAPPPTQPQATGVTARTQELASQVAGLVGINLAAVQAAPTVHLSLMILLFEIVCWPQAARNCRLGMAKAAAMAKDEQTPPEPPEPATVLTVEPEPIRKALPAPKGVRRDPKAITVRANPTPQWRAVLDRIDFPPPGARHKGPLRPKDPREHVALRFLIWMGSYREEGDFSQAQVEELYKEFAAADHREPWGIRIVKSELEAMGRKIANKWVGSDGTTWTIVPPDIHRLTTLLERRGVITGGVPGVASAGVLRFPSTKNGGAA